MSDFLQKMNAPVFKFNTKDGEIHVKMWTLLVVAFIIGLLAG